MIKNKWVEITTRIGCKNQCFYCPQKILVERYSGITVMTIDIFSKILDSIDKNTQIHFSGFSEAFLTDAAEDMMLEASNRGFETVLFTTLVGITPQKIQKLIDGKMHFSEVRFHEFKGFSFNKEKFEKDIELFKRIDSEIYSVVKVDQPMARGSNVYNIERKIGPLYICSRVYCNVVVPDGRLFLCCSDWGLKHCLGNLINSHYDGPEIQNKRQEIISSYNNRDSDILCRVCEWAHNK